MDLWFLAKIRVRCLTLLFLYAALFVSSNSWAKDTLLGQIKRLDESFQSVSSRFYQETSSTRHNYDDISQLHAEIMRLSARTDDIDAIQVLYNNESVVMDNVDDKAIFTFLRILLGNNEWSMANRIFDAIEEEGDKSLTATVHYIFAKYFANRQEWDKVNHLLENTITELAANDAAYGYLLKGVALQHLKRHRQALQYYNKVLPSSQYYPEAQLNIATADIRLGWWADADNVVKKLIQKNIINPDNELYNRLYLVIGYELLQKDYYRNARNAFRKVSLKSHHTNRALLGIGLTAVSQGDYVGGINALSILRNKQTLDLSVDESYLVLPYVYSKLQQELTVTAGYNEAVNYYKKRIATLELISNHHYTFDSVKYDTNTKSLIVDNNSFDYDNAFPKSFIDNYRLLINFSKNTIRQQQRLQINNLISEYDKVLQQIIKTLSGRRVTYLNSYLSQARYGLATLFDKSSKDVPKGVE